MGSFSIWHWLIVLLVIVLVFGTKKLRNIGSDLGGAVKGFKDGIKGGEAEGAPNGGGTPPRTGQTIEGEVEEGVEHQGLRRRRVGRPGRRGRPASFFGPSRVGRPSRALPFTLCSTSASPSSWSSRSSR